MVADIAFFRAIAKTEHAESDAIKDKPDLLTGEIDLKSGETPVRAAFIQALEQENMMDKLNEDTQRSLLNTAEPLTFGEARKAFSECEDTDSKEPADLDKTGSHTETENVAAIETTKNTGAYIVIYRGCTAKQADLIEKNKSAGGAKANPDCGKPTEKQAVEQVGNHEGIGSFNPGQIIDALKLRVNKNVAIAISPLTQEQKGLVLDAIDKSKEKNKDELKAELNKNVDIEDKSIDPGGVVEYTSNPGVAGGFGSGGDSVFIEIRIDPRYLTEGSRSEGGQICYNSAPISGFKRVS